MKSKTFLNVMVVFGLLLGSVVAGFSPSPASLAAPAGITRYAQPGGLSSGACDSWANACELQIALLVAVAGDEIWAQEGVYRPTDGSTYGSCQEIRGAFPDAADGDYLIKNGGNVFQVYCADMEGTPVEYLTLRDPDENYAQYTAGGYSPGTDVRTSYSRVRLLPETLQIDISDQRYSSSTGSLLHVGGTEVTSMPYGVAMDCRAAYSADGVAQIDLLSTPFVVSDTFKACGSNPGGDATYDDGDQMVYLTGGGDCGFWQPESPSCLDPSINDAGGSQPILELGYLGPERRATFQLKSGVAIYGGFAGDETSLGQRNWTDHETILSGDIGTPDDSSDNSYHVVTGSGVTETAVLDGFTISGGNANVSAGTLGGGMLNEYSSPTLRNLIFSGNTASNGGGGMYNDHSSPMLTQVAFSSNTATNGGGMYNGVTSSPTLTGVTFSGNSANRGGGMYNNSASPTLSGVTFSSNTATQTTGGGGGGMYNYMGSNPTLTDVTFTDNTSWGGGGMFNSHQSNPTLTRVTFSGNVGAVYGGGMANNGGSPRLTDCEFSGNSASRGGGMYNQYTSNPTLINVTFRNNSGYNGGGGMYNLINSSPTLTDCEFSGNTVTSSGGGIYNENSSPALTNVVLSGNTAPIGGGMYNNGSSPRLTDCEFSGNSADNYGGGMYNYMGSSPALTHTLFFSNTATDGGGMINRDNSSPTLTATQFVSNTADTGGGMFNEADSNPMLTNVTFSSNDATGSGGGMWNAGSPTLTGVTFSSNNATGIGGGMWNAGNATLTDCTFSDNTGFVGGGIYNDHSSPTLTNCTLSGNTALDGGGMFNEYSSPTLTNCTLSGNGAAIEGGGMRNTASSPMLTNVSFLGNTAGGDGGGMCSLSNSSLTLTNVEFVGNEAYTGGGMRNATSDATLVNVTFSGNTADYSGGGMRNATSNATLVNVTFSGNTAGNSGGGMVNDSSDPVLANSIFWGNTATSGPQIHNNTSNPSVTYSLVEGGYPSGSYIMDADPLFADPDGLDNISGTLDDDLRLLPGSPAIDTGNSLIVTVGTDLDGHPRIYGGEVDLGAYEAQCATWNTHYGFPWLEEGQKYRLGFHSDLVELDPGDTIAGTLESYASQQAGVKLTQAREYFEAALDCATTVTETRQALLGLQQVLWEQATAAMLRGNEEMVGALDLVDDDPADLGGEIAQLEAAIGYFDEATTAYLQPLTGAYGDPFLAALQLTRTHPLSDTQRYVDLERLSLAVAQKSRATLELAERQFRDGQRAEAEQSLREGQNAALVELTLLHTLWPEVVEEANYGAVLRNITDMTRIYSYLEGDENPFGYDLAFVPFHFDYRNLPKNNYEQTYDLADEDIGDAEFAVAAAQGKQEEIDDNYVQMQTRLEAAQDRYDDRLEDLCGGDLVHCSGGEVQTQGLAVEGAMLRMEAVVGQMEMQVELVKIEETRAATVAGIHRATAQMITNFGEELASLANEEAQLRFAKSDTQGFLGIFKKLLNFDVGTSGVSGNLSDSGVSGALFEWGAWEAEKDVAGDLADVYAGKERLYALQKARPYYAEGLIVEADSLALIGKYFLELGQLDIDYAIARNELLQELARLTSLQGQVQYLWTEKAKAKAFTVLLFQDPAGRVLRDHYVEIANDEYERALETTFEAGRALEYEINQDVPVQGAVLQDLEDLYALQDTVDLRLALDDIDDAHDDWRDGIGAPQTYPDEVLYLSEAVGFVDSYDPGLGRIVTKEEKFNAFIRDAGNRVDLDGNGSAESLKFTFQTSILGGNPAFETGVFNDKILAVNMRVRGSELGVAELKVKLTQGGTSLVRTRDAFQESDPVSGWIDDLRTYYLEPKTATIRAFANDEPFPVGATSYELATRSVASTGWTLLISKCSDQQTCGPYWIPDNLPLNLDNIDEIELIIDHEAYTLQAGQRSAAAFEPLPSRPYRPMEHVLPPLSLNRSPLKTQDQIQAPQSTAIDFNDTYVGAVVISQPLSLDPMALVVVLTDTQGSLSGYISPTLSYPSSEQDPGRGPAVSGSWAGGTFALQSEIFHTELSAGIVISRQVIVHSGVISDSGRILTGVYSETQAGLTSEPLEIVGEFLLDRPSHALVPAFGASTAAGTVPLVVRFQDLSLGNPTTWEWDFGDGGAASEQHPTHIYTQPGTYTVTLTVGNAFGSGTVVEAERITILWLRVYLPLVIRSAP